MPATTRDSSRSAFPAALIADVDAVLAIIPSSTHQASESDIGPVRLGGERLHIPFRLYMPEPDPLSVARLNNAQQVILACLYSRHHDGRIRQKHLNRILTSSLGFVPPFVLQLLGEYIIEIIEVLHARIDTLRSDPYTTFIKENPDFCKLTQQRILSYWNEYQRDRSPRLENYVGFRIANELGVWKS